MASFGARFNEGQYIKVDIDFDSGDNGVIFEHVFEGTPVTATGAIIWEDPDEPIG